MTAIKRLYGRGISPRCMLVIAAALLTLGYIGGEAQRISELAQLGFILRIAGKAAEPLLILLVVDAVRRTEKRRALILGLYIAAALTQLLIAAANEISMASIGREITPGTPNMLFTLFYAALHITLLQGAVDCYRENNKKRAAMYIGLFLLTFLPTIFYMCFYSPMSELVFGSAGAIHFSSRTALGVAFAILPSPLMVDSYIFVIMGILMYFAGTTRRATAVFAVFCVLCAAGHRLGLDGLTEFYGWGQDFMGPALPLLLLFQRGGGGYICCNRAIRPVRGQAEFPRDPLLLPDTADSRRGGFCAG